MTWLRCCVCGCECGCGGECGPSVRKRQTASSAQRMERYCTAVTVRDHEGGERRALSCPRHSALPSRVAAAAPRTSPRVHSARVRAGCGARVHGERIGEHAATLARTQHAARNTAQRQPAARISHCADGSKDDEAAAHRSTRAGSRHEATHTAGFSQDAALDGVAQEGEHGVTRCRGALSEPARCSECLGVLRCLAVCRCVAAVRIARGRSSISVSLREGTVLGRRWQGWLTGTLSLSAQHRSPPLRRHVRRRHSVRAAMPQDRRSGTQFRWSATRAHCPIAVCNPPLCLALTRCVLFPCCPPPLCSAHAKELNNPIPKSPLLFLKPPSCIITKGQLVKVPRQDTRNRHGEERAE